MNDVIGKPVTLKTKKDWMNIGMTKKFSKFISRLLKNKLAGKYEIYEIKETKCKQYKQY